VKVKNPSLLFIFRSEPLATLERNAVIVCLMPQHSLNTWRR